MGNEDGGPTLVVWVRPGGPTSEIRRWLKALLPTAILVASPAVLPLGDAYDVVTIDADAGDASPLSLADAIARDLRSRAEASRRATPAARRK